MFLISINLKLPNGMLFSRMNVFLLLYSVYSPGKGVPTVLVRIFSKLQKVFLFLTLTLLLSFFAFFPKKKTILKGKTRLLVKIFTNALLLLIIF